MTPEQFIARLGERYYAYVKNGNIIRVEKRYAVSEHRGQEWFEVSVNGDLEGILAQIPTLL